MKTFLEPLSSQEENACLKKIACGDKNARDELILHNMRLVAHVAKKYQGSEENVEDLFSIGTIGLIKAVQTFKPEVGCKFATYGIRCIENEMLMYFRAKKKTRGDVSLYEPIGMDKEGNQIKLMDVIENDEPDVLTEVEAKNQIRKIKSKIQSVLTKREFYVVSKRYGIYGEREETQKEIAKKLKISRSYVSRIEKRALEKLRQILEE